MGSRDYLSVNLVSQNFEEFFFSLDFYRITIDDRIILSDPITGFSAEVRNILEKNQLGAAQFFTNAVDTETSGVDLVGSHNHEFSGALLKLQAALSFAETDIRDLKSTSQLMPSSRLFNETQITRIEQGQPKERATFSASFIKDN